MCALQIEIDEFQNYEKAVGALTEAIKCVNKAKNKNQVLEAKGTFYKDRLDLIKRFTLARRWGMQVYTCTL